MTAGVRREGGNDMYITGERTFLLGREIIYCTRSVLLWNISKKSVRTGPAGRPAPGKTP